MYFRDKLSSDTTTPRTFSPDLAGLAAWLETQDGATTYHFTDPEQCLFGRFHAAIGRDIVGAFDQLQLLYPGAEQVALGVGKTYGAALRRARKVMRQQNPYPRLRATVRFVRELFAA